MGPLEATIKSLKNNIEAVRKENGELQRRWMASQMELVGLQNEALVANERVDRMKSQVSCCVFTATLVFSFHFLLQHSVLNQKRSRLLGQVQVQDGETKELENGIRQMRCWHMRICAALLLQTPHNYFRTDMSRLNDMLAKNGNLSQTLEEDNFSLEAEFINRLKDAENVGRPALVLADVQSSHVLCRISRGCRQMSRPPRLQKLFWSRSLSSVSGR